MDLRLLALAPAVVAGIPVVSPDRARVVDGDTYWLYVQGLFRQIHYIEVRLDGYDTPEKQGPLTTAWERSQAKVATQYAALWFVQHDTIMVDSNPDPEKYGRWLCSVYSGDSRLGRELAERDLAVPYHGTGKRWRDVYGRVDG